MAGRSLSCFPTASRGDFCRTAMRSRSGASVTERDTPRLVSAPASERSRPPNSSLAAGHPADAQGDVRWSAGPPLICGTHLAGPRPGRGAPWSATDGLGGRLDTDPDDADFHLCRHDGLILPHPRGVADSGRRAVGPFLEGFAKAGRVGETDALGDLVDTHMRILEQLSRERPAHLVDD